MVSKPCNKPPFRVWLLYPPNGSIGSTWYTGIMCGGAILKSSARLRLRRVKPNNFSCPLKTSPINTTPKDQTAMLVNMRESTLKFHHICRHNACRLRDTSQINTFRSCRWIYGSSNVAETCQDTYSQKKKHPLRRE